MIILKDGSTNSKRIIDRLGNKVKRERKEYYYKGTQKELELDLFNSLKKEDNTVNSIEITYGRYGIRIEVIRNCIHGNTRLQNTHIDIDEVIQFINPCRECENIKHN
ncbi:MAG: hypothetical protein ACRCXT_22125 [Paraclostridium sp.]